MIIIINIIAFATHTYFGNYYEVQNPSIASTPITNNATTHVKKDPIKSTVRDSLVYKDWSVDKVNDMIMYSSHGDLVWGHKFGWIKKQGHCDDDLLYLTFSTQHESKELLENLTDEHMQLTLSFPEIEGISNVIKPKIVSSNDFGSMKIVTLSNINKDKIMDQYMQQLAKIDVAINAPFKHLFDIPHETWSLNGYVASQLKAKEMCESLPTKGEYKIALNKLEPKL